MITSFYIQNISSEQPGQQRCVDTIGFWWTMYSRHIGKVLGFFPAITSQAFEVTIFGI